MNHLVYKMLKRVYDNITELRVIFSLLVLSDRQTQTLKYSSENDIKQQQQIRKPENVSYFSLDRWLTQLKNNHNWC